MYSCHYRSGKHVFVSGDAEYQTKNLFGLLQEAIIEVGSGTRLRSLDLLVRYHYRDSVVDIISSYTGMRELCFDVDTQTLRDRNTFVALEQLLTAAPRLERLTFAAGRNNKKGIPFSALNLVTEIFNIRTTCALQALNLQDVACSLEAIQKLMERHKQTLNQIKFVRVIVLGSWQTCMSWMRKELDLANFHIEQVWILDRSRTNSQGAFMAKASNLLTTSSRGKENTRMELDGLVQSLSSGSAISMN